jgi:hypothetical protein
MRVRTLHQGADSQGDCGEQGGCDADVLYQDQSPLQPLGTWPGILGSCGCVGGDEPAKAGTIPWTRGSFSKNNWFSSYDDDNYFLCKVQLQARMNNNKARLGECMNKFVLVLLNLGTWL